MSGSRQQLDKISVSDIQLMSLHGSVFSTIVSAHQSVGKTFFTRGPAGANTWVTKRRSCPRWASLVVMLADRPIAIAVHDGRQ